MNSNLTEIVCVIDRSGSMSGIKSDAEAGLNAFIKEQKSLLNQEVNLTLAQFDDKYDLLFDGVSLKNTDVNYHLAPRGWTALLDAVGKTINHVGERLSKTPEDQRPGKVVVMIVTDGEENRSTEYSFAQIKQMIEHQTNHYSWQFMYIGANQDAFAVGSSLGVVNNMRYAFDSAGTRSAYTTASASVMSYRNTSDPNASVVLPTNAP